MMTCKLCGGQVTLLDLDSEGWAGEPAHEVCATAAREAIASIAAELDPRMHRGRRRPVNAA